MSNYLFFDTETNGLPRNRNAPLTDLKNWPRLVQIAWVKYDEKENEVEDREYIIQPEGFKIPYDAVRIHGITNERALAEGVALVEVLKEFTVALDEAKVLIAHNMSYDEKIVGAEFLRKNIPNRLFDMPRICTMKASTNFCRIPGRYGYKWPTLAELHQKLFHTKFQESHHAAVDVKACARCFFELKRLGIIFF